MVSMCTAKTKYQLKGIEQNLKNTDSENDSSEI